MNDIDKASKDRLNCLETELSLLKKKQGELTEQWEHEKSVMTRLRSIKEEVCHRIFITFAESALSFVIQNR